MDEISVPLSASASTSASADAVTPALGRLLALLDLGGPVIWAIAALSVLTLTVVLWKLWHLMRLGAWSGGAATARALALWQSGAAEPALAALEARRSLRARVTRAAMCACRDPDLDDEAAREETTRTARTLLAEAGAGLRVLELAATIGPLLGLFGTVTGMIGAFQALQEAGAQADPATLAGGIWQALLTTAAGMAVAIPAQIALTGFEGVLDRLRHDLEDRATAVFLAARRAQARAAA
ncbi:MotA/TolQ/ExbB proton channel family protein [Phaeovulum vinaykumarii]|uniref:Outer membrane transport energization protein ExbB n=1 Tax=Phaeovulum vinaykumarii TaxID=407234 RepID=A0A1N7L8V3_9RHOB|nr:MotA/TolQ/ExbB proton channel family protein [Phaeovulum vinaykumarii]SIS70256.1 outer membrane transport energization protein ExbB [Phaeovulum vinaykumarii]SOB99019.1 biopolymer transport protein ExbB [Phaeovulum vinaykumarii]